MNQIEVVFPECNLASSLQSSSSKRLQGSGLEVNRKMQDYVILNVLGDRTFHVRCCDFGVPSAPFPFFFVSYQLRIHVLFISCHD